MTSGVPMTVVSVQFVWTETEFIDQGRQSVDFNGEYRAVIRDRTVKGAWYKPAGSRVPVGRDINGRPG